MRLSLTLVGASRSATPMSPASSVFTHLFLVYTEHDNRLIAANADELVDRADTPARQLAEQNETLETESGEQAVKVSGGRWRIEP